MGWLWWLHWQLLSGSLPGGRPVVWPYMGRRGSPFAAARLLREGGQQRPSVHCPPLSRTGGTPETRVSPRRPGKSTPPVSSAASQRAPTISEVGPYACCCTEKKKNEPLGAQFPRPPAALIYNPRPLTLSGRKLLPMLGRAVRPWQEGPAPRTIPVRYIGGAGRC